MRPFGSNPTLSIAVILCAISLMGCALPFERPDELARQADTPSGKEIFANTFEAHGGDNLDQLLDVNVSLTGQWPFLIKRIQPLVTDYTFRVDSEERLMVQEKMYTALYQGPAGSKKVVYDQDKIQVFYNEEETLDEDVLNSSAMTAEAFFLFLLGPLALEEHAEKFVRLTDATEKGKKYYRLYAVLEPGFGFAEKDEIIIWIDKETNLTFRLNITLEGYKSTKGAHVDVSYLSYADKSGFILPVAFHERVLGPVRIKAHDWQLEGIDINRGYKMTEIDGDGYSGLAALGAEPYNPPNGTTQ